MFNPFWRLVSLEFENNLNTNHKIKLDPKKKFLVKVLVSYENLKKFCESDFWYVT